MVEPLLQALKKVRRTGDRQWQACCPAHEDKTPSLAVKELHDGRVLINCYAGCGGSDIMEAVGMTLSDLYPDGELQQWMRTGGRKRYDDRKKAKSIHLEQQVLEIAKCDRQKGLKLNQADLEREFQAFVKLRQMGGTPL